MSSRSSAKRNPMSECASGSMRRTKPHFICVLTFGEIRKGITLLPQAEKRTKLEKWLETELPGRFKGRLLPVTDGIAEIWGSMAAKAQIEGIGKRDFGWSCFGHRYEQPQKRAGGRECSRK